MFQIAFSACSEEATKGTISKELKTTIKAKIQIESGEHALIATH